MGQSGKAFGIVDTPASALLCHQLGAQRPLIHSQAFFQLPSAPESMVSYAYFSQVQGRDKKHRKGFCSTDQKSISQWRGKDPHRAKNMHGTKVSAQMR